MLHMACHRLIIQLLFFKNNLTIDFLFLYNIPSGRPRIFCLIKKREEKNKSVCKLSQCSDGFLSDVYRIYLNYPSPPEKVKSVQAEEK